MSNGAQSFRSRIVMGITTTDPTMNNQLTRRNSGRERARLTLVNVAARWRSPTGTIEPDRLRTATT